MQKKDGRGVLGSSGDHMELDAVGSDPQVFEISRH